MIFNKRLDGDAPKAARQAHVGILKTKHFFSRQSH
jgi:hypothetical protein